MNLATRLIEEVERKRVNIVVCGDIMVDRWVSGYVTNCQDGCQKFVKDSEVVERPGGAGNAHSCLKEWGTVARLFGQNYTDSPKKWRFVDGGVIVFRFDDEYTTLSDTEYTRVRRHMVEAANGADGVLISDYDKGFLTPDTIRTLIDVCRWCNIPCVVDVKRPPDMYDGAILKGNVDWCNINKMCDVVTHGDRPPFVKGISRVDRLPPVKCVNHVGAGDCFAAHLVLALACGFSLWDAATVAHSAGRVYVQHPHNRAPHPCEIEADLLCLIM